MHIANIDQASSDITTTTQCWTSSSGGRSTFDIIWNSFITIILCGWTTICVNVPARGSTNGQRLLRKLLVFCEALAGPEFIFHTALSQYLAARRSVRKFTDAGFPGWTMRHGFYAGMGGFVLQSKDFVPFPLSVDQVYYLVVNGYIDYHAVLIDKEDIEDKNKFDTLTRVLTTVQLGWFVVNVSARGVLGMAITTLELSTIAFIFCTLFTCFFWRHKPQDVSSPIIISLKVPLSTILVSAGDVASQLYSYTPLDFANESPHWFQHVWRYCFNIAHVFKFSFHSKKRPIDKIWDDEFSPMGVFHGITLAFVQLGFAALHFAAWNFAFPTNMERILWRVSASYILLSMICTWTVLYAGFEICPQVAMRVEKYILPAETAGTIRLDWRARLYLKCKKICQHQCNNTSNKSLNEGIPLPVLVFLLPLGAIYMLLRAYIIIEDFIYLRSVPPSVYDNINWMSFLPQF